MRKCPNPDCCAEVDDGMKFCGECGTRMPEVKRCPHCSAEVADASKFCPECGFNFSSRLDEMKDGNPVGQECGIRLGDKNVVSGDIVGHQEDYQIAGRATIVRNIDETKRMVKCHSCGRNMTIAESFDCPVCHEKTCSDCYDRALGSCKSCAANKKQEKESVYSQALSRVLSDGKVDLSERRTLMTLQKQLGISASRALELESEVKAEILPANSSEDELSTFERFSLQKAVKAFYEDLDFRTAIALLDPIYSAHKANERILTMYLELLAVADPMRAKSLIAGLHTDILGAYLAEIDVLVNEGNLTAAEDKLLAAENMWPRDVKVVCRRIRFLLAMKEVTGNDEFLAEAYSKLGELGDPKDELETSWILTVQRLVSSAMGEQNSPMTQERCKDKGLYYAVVRLSN